MAVRRVNGRENAVQDLAPTRQGMFFIHIITKLEKAPQSATDEFLLCFQYLHSVNICGVKQHDKSYRWCVFGLYSDGLGSESHVAQTLHCIRERTRRKLRAKLVHDRGDCKTPMPDLKLSGFIFDDQVVHMPSGNGFLG